MPMRGSCREGFSRHGLLIAFPMSCFSLNMSLSTRSVKARTSTIFSQAMPNCGKRRLTCTLIDRGGDVTFHGPGQLVGYPILDLNNYYLDIHRYLRDIEEVLIRSAKDFGICAERSDGYTGVWVKSDKLAAIGVKVSRWVTMHGFAFNANTDLSYFDRIIPCGIFHKGVTSVHALTGREVEMADVEKAVVRNFESVFSVSSQPMMLNELLPNILPESVLPIEEKMS